ncbi:glucose-6-phosphate exchanger SLC37A2 isoform X1 [Hermetia illucens]|uniref:glucose-6-phosphate exchanger SLC37A2 isoform X1 n=1 Tax=Hermetia illucens TaxID=343691 RepID=UPI0018CC3BD3|nr:glucose-6-phosphate exchanger SLC37A2 isoform X1 [Hermetia illucens]XP_037912714.1 glucose-6-phosphate exchanger SLC37A2 isoform X1 [Hermetia illucens]
MKQLLRSVLLKTRSRSRKMSASFHPEIPVGIRAIETIVQKCCNRIRFRRELLFKFSVLFLTYAAYTCYHMSRKPISVVKSVLHRNCSELEPPPSVLPNDTNWCDYAPFDTNDAPALFGALDSAFLFCYAAAMFVSGFVAERVSIRYFLSFGMILSGIFTYLLGVAKTSSIHNLWYFLIVQAFAGVVQTTGWPGVVTVVGRWFGKTKRGLIFGIWNSHTSIGNILGSVIAAAYVESDWSLSFIVPGIIMGCVGFIIFLFLVDSPDLVGCHTPNLGIHRRVSSASDIEGAADPHTVQKVIVIEPVINLGSINTEVSYRPTERTPMLSRTTEPRLSERAPIKLLDALYIPGVIEFSLCLFFSKLVSYTFLYWLPLYIQSSTTLGATYSADLSTIFDVGGIVGAITAGVISDYTHMSATTCASMLFLAAPMLLLYHQYGAVSLTVGIVLLFVAGILVNGPYALITTSVSAELGTHTCLEGNSRALATVTAIIDGTGSIGAAVGPMLAGLVSSSGWQNVFYMLIISDILAMILLVRLVSKEFARFRRNARIE